MRIDGADFSTTSLPHTTHVCRISERGRCRGDLQAKSNGGEAAVGSSRCGLLQRYVYFTTFYETPPNK